MKQGLNRKELKMKGKMFISAMVVLMAGILVFGGCESDAQTGALLGSLAGAGIGQLAGGDTESTLIGAGVGGVTGYIIGSEKDKQQARAEVGKLRQEMSVVPVNIRNSNNSISQVLMKKDGIGYRGPNGEFYDHLPTEAKLKPIYGF